MFNPRDMENYITTCSEPPRLLDRGVNNGMAGEIGTQRYLYEHLKESSVVNYHALAQYNFFPRGKANSLEIDLLVITTFGIFLLEVKNWLGDIKAYDDQWECNGQPYGNVFSIASHKAKVIHSYLSRRYINGLSCDAGKISVVSLIVLVQGTQHFENLSAHDTPFVADLNPQLIHLLSSTELVHRTQSPRLNDKDIHLLRETLFRCHKRKKYDVVGGYRLLEKVRQTQLFQEFEAQRIDTEEDQLVRLKSYQLHTFVNERTTKDTIRHFRRAHDALSSLQSHPNIVGIKDFFPDPKYYDLYHEITEPIDGERLDEWITQKRQQGQQISLTEQFALLNEICQALQYAHTHPFTPIYHRNVCLETVFVTRDSRSGKTVFKLADFNFAKFGTHTVNTAFAGQDETRTNWLDNVFTAPELQKKPSDASARSDIYSLGILWYFLALCPKDELHMQLDSRPDAHKIDALPLPDEARILLKSMVAQEPRQRPPCMGEVIERLKAI